MKKLDPKNQISVTKDTISQILKSFAIFDYTFKTVSEGISNTSLIIETQDTKYVLRIYAVDRKDDSDIIFEIQFQDYLRAQGIPIPLIYPNNLGDELTITEIEGKRWQSILSEFIEGESITPHPSLELMSELATLQAKMHLLGINYAQTKKQPKKLWEDLHDELAGKIHNHPISKDKKIVDFIERVKSYRYLLSPKLPHGYNHLDIDFDGNVITKDNKINGIVDFEDVQYSPVIVCLGFTLWNILNDQGLEAMRYYLKEYEKLRPLNKEEYEVLPHAIFFRNYAIGMIRLLLWEDTTAMSDFEDILRLEKEIHKIEIAGLQQV
ncbi:MAG: phosphotransferase [Candidatus Taylorbacteria bacterium]